jgi:hypothetical protein
MSCSCGCSPCCCNTIGEVDASECLDPGITKTGAYASVINEDMCPRRVHAYRGLKDDGSLNTDPAAPLKAAVFTQTSEGDVGWTDSPCYLPPTKLVRVANDDQAADPTNFVKYLLAKNDSGCEVALTGSTDVTSGQWRLVWVASTRKWTTVPDTGENELNSSLCTTLMSDVTVDEDTTEVILRFASTAIMSVGVSVKVNSREFAVTEVIDEEYVRAEVIDLVTGSPVTLEGGSTVCCIGFRPCPRSIEPYADTMVACLNNVPVALETPEDVHGKKVPGLWWRDQLGQVSFLPFPVDPDTGIVLPNYAFHTPADPSGDGANIPQFSSAAQKAQWLAGKVTVASKFTGSPSSPSFGIEDDVISVTPHSGSFDMTGVAGYTAGKSVAVVRAVVLVDESTGAHVHAQIKLNNLVILEGWIDDSREFSYKNDLVIEVPLTDDAFTYELVTTGDGIAFAKLEVIGFK